MIFKKKTLLLIKMTSKEVISIGKTKRLIDLNKSYTNFKLTFNDIYLYINFIIFFFIINIIKKLY